MAAAPAEALGPGRPPPASPRWAAPPLRPGEWGTSLTPAPSSTESFSATFFWARAPARGAEGSGGGGREPRRCAPPGVGLAAGTGGGEISL